MTNLQNYKNKNVGILGLGKSGIATFNYLKALQANIYLWDDYPSEIYQDYMVKPNDPKWQEIDELIISPGIAHKFPKPHELIANLNPKCKIFCDIELFAKSMQKNNKIIGITGTNGKSTTTALTHHILAYNNVKNEMCGNIGVPALSIKISNDTLYVVEVSSYQLDKLVDSKFDIAVLTNITRDHLAMHNGMDGYIEAKLRIFKYQTKDDYGVICIDNQFCKNIYQQLKQSSQAKIIAVSKKEILANGVSYFEGIIYDNYFSHQTIKLTTPITLSGEHNQENMICAITASLASGLTLKQIVSAIESFKSLEHRAEYVGEHKGVIYINDSKGTNFESTRHCLAAFNNIHWILGGVAKEGGIDGFEEYKKHIKQAYLIGESQNQFAKILQDKIAFIKCGNLKNAFNEASINAKSGDAIILSPACASLDQWKNFEERGKAFKEYFTNLL